jgi:hypothetical protein
MTGIVIGGVVWFVIAYTILCLPLDLEIRKIRKERKNK